MDAALLRADDEFDTETTNGNSSPRARITSTITQIWRPTLLLAACFGLWWLILRRIW